MTKLLGFIENESIMQFWQEYEIFFSAKQTQNLFENYFSTFNPIHGLTTINLTNSPLGDNVALIELLFAQPTLEILNLNNTLIGHKALKVIAGALEKNLILKKLNLGNNNLTEQDGTTLLIPLLTQTVLIELNMNGNTLSNYLCSLLTRPFAKDENYFNFQPIAISDMTLIKQLVELVQVNPAIKKTAMGLNLRLTKFSKISAPCCICDNRIKFFRGII